MSKESTFYAAYVADMFKTETDSPQDQDWFLAHYATLHAAVGLAGEAGEVLDVIKKQAFVGKAVNREALVKELGDVEFYLQALRNATGIDREEVLNANVIKLNARHPEGFEKSTFYKDKS